MKIVVLDGFTLNPGDLSWEPLQQLGEVILHDRTAPSAVVSRLEGSEIALTNKVVIDGKAIGALPTLRYIGVTATGYNIVDVEAARQRKILVSNVPAYGTDSVAQAVFALLLELTNRVGHHARAVGEGRWSRSPDFCFWEYPLVELAGKTMGIIGYGRIGQKVGQIAQAFGMQVLATQRTQKPPHDGVQVVSLDRLLAESDVVSLHCPLTPETQNMINAERLARMKKEAFLINTSRGQLVVEEDLARALNSGRLAGAGLDVLQVEPPPSNHPLYAARNCYITPHIAWATRAARQRLLSVTVDNVRRFLQGTPQNVVNAPLAAA